MLVNKFYCTACYNQLIVYCDIYNNNDILVDGYHSTKFQYYPSLEKHTWGLLSDKVPYSALLFEYINF